MSKILNTINANINTVRAKLEVARLRYDECEKNNNAFGLSVVAGAIARHHQELEILEKLKTTFEKQLRLENALAAKSPVGFFKRYFGR